MTRETEHLEQQNAILRTLLAEAHRKLALTEVERDIWKDGYHALSKEVSG